uniref:(California timema) hypothetical protein n=1 Tax=Timema californicum TaxID=61474 RepID=A0A7R9J929_TIMCA|nr:unnamed protein product [Timema californicum]
MIGFLEDQDTPRSSRRNIGRDEDDDITSNNEENGEEDASQDNNANNEAETPISEDAMCKKQLLISFMKYFVNSFTRFRDDAAEGL